MIHYNSLRLILGFFSDALEFRMKFWFALLGVGAGQKTPEIFVYASSNEK